MPAIPVNLRVNEGCATQTIPYWDSVWDPTTGTADWAYALPSETQNRGGLRATSALDSAVILCLFTDKYCPPNHPLAYLIEAGDPRGYWGDGVDVRADLGEAELGSLLWLLERSVATPIIAAWAQALALDALGVMVGQGSVAKVEAIAKIVGINRIDLSVRLFARDGATLYAREFADFWNQAAPAPSGAF